MAAETTVVIEAVPPRFFARLASLWQYRGFYGFLFREIMMRKFRNTLLGFWWLLIRPLIPAALLIVAFTVVQPMSGTEGVPYPLFFLSGFITWNLFQSTVTFTPRTMMWMRGVMRRTYFPRLLVPLAGFGMPLIQCVVLFLVFSVTVGIYWYQDSQYPLVAGWHVLWLIPCLLAALMLGLAIGMVASVVALFFRDVIYTMGYFTQVFMLLTPIIYPVTFIPESYRWLLYTLNPMAQIVETSRFALTGSGGLNLPFFVLSVVTILALFTTSVMFLLRAETYLADEL